MVNPKLVISLDYGTSASAAAYRFVNHRGRNIPRGTRTVVTWPMHGDPTLGDGGKVPSKFAYGAENNVDHDSWGYEVTEGMTSCSWTKLALEASANGRVPDERGLGNGVIRVPLGKQAHSVVSDYLRRLHEHVWSLEPLRSIRNLEVEYILTFPASFSKEAQQAIVAAAEHAGFRRGTRKLLTESEAAAGYVFEQGLLGEMKAGEKVMVVDLGGGTSDVSTYIALGVQNGLQLQEWTRPQSRNVGGTNIDRNFSALLTARFDPEFAALPPYQTGPSSRLMREFEIHKRLVTDGDENAQQIRIALPMDPVDPNPLYFDEDYSEIIISMDDWRTVFNPVLEEIIAFIQDRYNAANGVQYIVLVGGLVNLPWIREAFRSIFDAEHISVSLIFSPEPVGRGARSHLACRS
ncbi:hypothetical protein ASPBRDRAFT_428468 [Aspergillus brasiliensis CBS 101740]|uniref:Uncharacterized protein n=1 Tax=Aspergillus brasiliensis (strain CBS 101740 / IMI 381727 / IBT 21946) TaxID=767769 RepID=A0A1L9U3H0_ASPBC|nr:hypothetical protein ASPBRDRAFT_428468 [Aspergillus brasiliensis CBS 101740]